MRLDRDAFDRLLDRHPRMGLGLSRAVVERLRDRTAARSPARRLGANIAVLPAVRGASPLASFTPQFVRALEAIGTVAHVSRASFDPEAGEAGEAARVHAPGTHPEELTDWLDRQESEHAFVVYEADADLSPWTRRCLRQADVVVCVADAAGDAGLSVIEAELLHPSNLQNGVRRGLVLVHPPETTQPTGTAKWLTERSLSWHQHIRGGVGADMARLARVLTGTAVGLVLGGGAARGFAHVGTFRALCEAGVPVDWVGGASIGSAMGALIALGHAPSQLRDICRRVFVEENPLGDYTLPLVSLVRGRRLTRQLREHLDLDIEAHFAGCGPLDPPVRWICRAHGPAACYSFNTEAELRSALREGARAMWRRLRNALRRLWSRRRGQGTGDGVARDRARFWAELREGEREAEAAARSGVAARLEDACTDPRFTHFVASLGALVETCWTMDRGRRHRAA